MDRTPNHSNQSLPVQVGGIVLCGGKSSRMGLPKATLPFGPELMLQRVVRLLSQIVEPLVVVAAPQQQLPELPADVTVTYDRRQDRGPLEGLHAGLLALQGRADAAYATSCDVPLLVPDYVRRMIQWLDHYQAVVPIEGRFHHPLAAVYRVELVGQIEQLLAADRLRPVFLYEQIATRRVTVEQLRDVDPQLRTLANLNHPQDYLAALAEAGFEAPPEIRARLSENRHDKRCGMERDD